MLTTDNTEGYAKFELNAMNSTVAWRLGRDPLAARDDVDVGELRREHEANVMRDYDNGDLVIGDDGALWPSYKGGAQ